MSTSPGDQQLTGVRRRFAAFLANNGVPDPEGWLCDYDLIELFVTRGLPGCRDSTKGTYRSVLARLAVVVHGPPTSRATPFPGSPGPLPYTGVERAELFSIAAAQPKAATRSSGLALLAASLGAGCSAGELVALRGPDVTVSDTGSVVVGIRGRRKRAVPLSAPYDRLALSLAREAGVGNLFRPGPADRTYKNFVNDFCAGLVADPAAPRLSVARARSSFICDRLAAQMALSEIVAASGLCEVESLARYARYVAGVPHTKAALRARLATEECP